jgi:hypothetical protein
MKKRTSILSIGAIGLVMLLGMHIGYAQSPIWTIPNQFLDFESGLFPNNLPTPSGTDVYAGEQAQYAHNAAYNPVTGKLLFFVVDNKVYDKDGYLINEMIAAETEIKVNGTSEISIVADPSNCKRYYIFAGGREYSGDFTQSKKSHMYFSILDLEMPRRIYNTNRKGDLIQVGTYSGAWTSSNIKDFIPLSDYPTLTQANYRPDVVHVAVSTPLPNSANRLIVFQMSNTHIYHFELTTAGLVYKTVINPMTGQYPEAFTPSAFLNRSELEIIRIGNSYRIGGQTANGKRLYIYDIDNNGNVIPESHRIFNTNIDAGHYIKGLEFSENGRYLYYSHSVSASHPKAIECFDTETSNLVTLPSIPAAQLEAFQYSQLEMGQDGKIYAVTENRMASISNTNNPRIK